MTHSARLVFLLVSFVVPAAARGQGFPPSWVRAFDGPSSLNDDPTRVLVAPGGEVYVAGWTFVPAGPSNQTRFFTLKYDPSGQLLWSQVYGSGSGLIGVVGLALDGNGDVLVGGYSMDGSLWSVVKHDSDGNHLWTASVSTNGLEAADMVVTPAGEAILVGPPASPGINSGYVMKFGPGGTTEWVRHFTGSGVIGDILGVDLAPGGAIALAGSSHVSGLAAELAVALLDDAGNPLWLRTSGYAGSSTYDRARDLVVDSAGRIVVAGAHGINTAAGSDAVVRAYDLAGNLQWARVFDGAANDDELHGIALAPDGSFRAVGQSLAPNNDTEALILSLEPSGLLQWARIYATVPFHSDVFRYVAVDGHGKAFAVGRAGSFSANFRMLLQVRDADGNELGTAFHGDPSLGTSLGNRVALGAGGAVYVVGPSTAANGSWDAVTLRYDDDAPRSYCTAKLASPGCLPQIGWSGTPTAGGTGAFHVLASDVVNQQLGTFFYGTAGAQAQPFQGGTLCADAPVLRTPIQSSGGNPLPTDCSGTYSLDFDAWVASGADPALVAGARVYGQYWFRDPDDPVGSGLSDAITFLLQP